MENCPKCKRIHERTLKADKEEGRLTENLVDEERHQPTMTTLKA